MKFKSLCCSNDILRDRRKLAEFVWGSVKWSMLAQTHSSQIWEALRWKRQKWTLYVFQILLSAQQSFLLVWSEQAALRCGCDRWFLLQWKKIWAITSPHLSLHGLIHKEPRCLEGRIKISIPLLTHPTGRHSVIAHTSPPALAPGGVQLVFTSAFLLESTGFCVCVCDLPSLQFPVLWQNTWGSF